jgi:hypothetical protein
MVLHDKTHLHCTTWIEEDKQLAQVETYYLCNVVSQTKYRMFFRSEVLYFATKDIHAKCNIFLIPEVVLRQWMIYSSLFTAT